MMKQSRLIAALTLVAGLAGAGVTRLAKAQEPSPTNTAPVKRARISGGVMASQIITKVPPLYPEEARVQHVSGSVVMHAVIATDGSVKELNVVSGPEVLRNAALDAVHQWRYHVYMLNGQPAEVETTIVVNFNLGVEH